MSTVPIRRFIRHIEWHDGPMETPCWVWRGFVATPGNKYVRFRLGGRGTTRVPAHRWLYEQLHGAVPAGLELDHLCRDGRCVNPQHLEPVTHRENLLRGHGVAATNNRKSACPKGHAYSHRDGRGRRVCRACEVARYAEVTACP